MWTPPPLSLQVARVCGAAGPVRSSRPCSTTSGALHRCVYTDVVSNTGSIVTRSGFLFARRVGSRDSRKGGLASLSEPHKRLDA